MTFLLGALLFALGIGVSIALHEAGHRLYRLVYYDLRDGEIRALTKVWREDPDAAKVRGRDRPCLHPLVGRPPD